MPSLWALTAAGTRFAHARSISPSETRAATPSLITGCRTGAHGTVANTLFDAAAAPNQLLRTKLPEDLALLAIGNDTSVERERLQHYPLTLIQCDRISCCRFNDF